MARLAAFLELLPAGQRATFEFRHESWLTDEVYDLLRGHGVALCLADTEKLIVPEVVTADFVYERLRKPLYSDDELAAIAARSQRLLAAGLDCYLVFKHEESAAGGARGGVAAAGGLRARRCATPTAAEGRLRPTAGADGVPPTARTACGARSLSARARPGRLRRQRDPGHQARWRGSRRRPPPARS